MKFNKVKNVTTSIRINSEYLKLIKEKSITPQKIIDKYIRDHFEENKGKNKERKGVGKSDE